MSNVVAYARAQQHSHNGARRIVNGSQRRCGVEGSASGKTHDVVQEPQRAGNAAVLVVDFRIDVSGISLHNDVCGWLKILLRPWAKGDVHQFRCLKYRSRTQRE